MSFKCQVKPVAAGFSEDVTKLLSAFATLKTTEFLAFASLWKRYNFSLIFMGLPDYLELTEFTNKAFTIASQYLLSSTFFYEVGAIFLLYALYRNQISDPPIKIRIQLRHQRVIDELRKEAALKSFRTLHYVIDFLIEHAFVHVVCQTLKGPKIATLQPEPRKSEAYSAIKAMSKTDITEYMTSNNFKHLNELHNEYIDVKKKVKDQPNLNRHGEKDAYNRFQKDLEDLVQSDIERTSRQIVETENEEVSIGARRAKIKTQAFMNSYVNWRDESANVREVEDYDETPNYEPKQQFRKLHSRHTVKKEKKVGRPRKNPSPQPEEIIVIKPDVHSEISEFSDDEDGLYPPKKEFTATGRKVRASRFDYYNKIRKYKEKDEEGEHQ